LILDDESVSEESFGRFEELEWQPGIDDYVLVRFPKGVFNEAKIVSGKDERGDFKVSYLRKSLKLKDSYCLMFQILLLFINPILLRFFLSHCQWRLSIYRGVVIFHLNLADLIYVKIFWQKGFFFTKILYYLILLIWYS
jgi:hypothetical protein